MSIWISLAIQHDKLFSKSKYIKSLDLVVTSNSNFMMNCIDRNIIRHPVFCDMNKHYVEWARSYEYT